VIAAQQDIAAPLSLSNANTSSTGSLTDLWQVTLVPFPLAIGCQRTIEWASSMSRLFAYLLFKGILGNIESFSGAVRPIGSLLKGPDVIILITRQTRVLSINTFKIRAFNSLSCDNHSSRFFPCR